MEFTNNPKLDRPKTRRKSAWIKFTVVTLLSLLFLIWIRSWWGLIVLPFIFDAYITKFIPGDSGNGRRTQPCAAS